MAPTEWADRAGGHPGDGTLVRYLDGELSEADHERVLRHVRTCGTCTERLGQLRTVSDRLARELAHAGFPPSLKRAARRDTEPTRRDQEQHASSPAPLPAAGLAVLLLAVTVVIASATLPPVRGWIAERAAEVAALVTDRPAGPPAGVRARPTAGELVVAVWNAAPGTRVRVEVVAGERGGAWSRGAAFRMDRSRLEVEPVEGEEVLVELPRDVGTASLEVNGRRWLTVRDGRLETLTAPERRAEGALLFRVPQPEARP